ncbi:MAG: hypothetical protein ABIH76_08840 [Candidatus Bathyarchaeota archaeon]
MSKRIIERKITATPSAKKLLEDISHELNQFQRRTLDYTTAFSKVHSEDVEDLVKKLRNQLKIEDREAVWIVNCMPESVAEMRTFLPKHKMLETSVLQEAVKLLDQCRK